MDAPRTNRLAAILGIIAGLLGITAAVISYTKGREVSNSALFGGLTFLFLGISLWMRSRR